MPETIVAKLFESIAQQGLSLSLLAVAVVVLWRKIKECEDDRLKLWEKLFHMSEHSNRDQR
jgi:hypothetical protein